MQVLDQAGLCLDCWGEMQFIAQPICDVTGTPLPYGVIDGTIDNGADRLLSIEALHQPPHYSKARIAVKFSPISRKLIHKLKYQDQQHIAPLMAKMMVNAARDILPIEPQSAVICPVPLYHWRYFKRRFNQADILAKNIAKLTKINYMPKLVKRHRSTKTQVGLTRLERQNNVKGAFKISPKYCQQAQGKVVFIVDDVVTTGATVDELATSLMAAGLGPIYILAFAKVIKDTVL
ncbi:MAG: ComF family protein [Rhizobiales bacterium]|nr:ComF family protein [Hyphomicrobiales bacterium]NRB15695.1 ComF family protein [Hyphomicrobiales bacterium]